MKTPWIIANDATGPNPYMLQCQRCGGVQKFTPPLSLDYFVGVAKVFGRVHRDCKEPRPRVSVEKKHVHPDWGRP